MEIFGPNNPRVFNTYERLILHHIEFVWFKINSEVPVVMEFGMDELLDCTVCVSRKYDIMIMHICDAVYDHFSTHEL